MTLQQISVQTLPDDIRGKLRAADNAAGDGEAEFAAVLEATIAAGRISPELARPHVSRLWFTPWRFDPGEHVRAREAAWLEPTSAVEIHAAGQQLVGYRAGTGPAVLLVHGWGDCAARLGGFVEPLLRRGLSVLAFDMPGHGSSGGRGLPDLYQFADALRDIVREMSVEGVVAHSIGAQALGMALPDLPALRAAALVAPAVRIKSALDTFVALFDLPQGAVDGLRADIDERFGPQTWTDVDATLNASDARIPALIAWSADDDQVPIADVQELAEVWPGARTLPLDGLGHSRILRDPQVVDGVAEFLSACLDNPVRS